MRIVPVYQASFIPTAWNMIYPVQDGQSGCSGSRESLPCHVSELLLLSFELVFACGVPLYIPGPYERCNSNYVSAVNVEKRD